jgi:hypothetical protein
MVLSQCSLLLSFRSHLVVTLQPFVLTLQPFCCYAAALLLSFRSGAEESAVVVEVAVVIVFLVVIPEGDLLLTSIAVVFKLSS